MLTLINLILAEGDLAVCTVKRREQHLGTKTEAKLLDWKYIYEYSKSL